MRVKVRVTLGLRARMMGKVKVGEVRVWSKVRLSEGEGQVS